MTAELTPRPAGRASIPLPRRLFGFGSIYGKTMRDSRLSFIIAAGLMGGMALIMGVAISSIFGTPAARQDIDMIVGAIPKGLINLFGKPVELGTLGGYLTYKYGAMFALGTTLWSIFALTGTLAGEAARGSLDLVAATPFGKRRIALEKLAANQTVLWGALAVLAVATTVSASVFGDASQGDAIPPLSSIGFALWLGFLAMFFGGIAFALSQVVGRGGAVAISAVVMLALWLANGLDVGGPLVAISPYHWTSDHIALVGRYDWGPLILTGVEGVIFLAIGVELFVRRDLGATTSVGIPRLPGALLGVGGPVGRAFGEMLPRALAWGIGMGAMGALLGALVGPMASQLRDVPDLIAIFQTLFPGVDFESSGGWFQLYAELLFIAAGFAGATFVAKWRSDETDGRLEMVLAAPMARARWVVAGGIAAVLAVALTTVLFAIGIGIGSASSGVSGTDPMLGSAALGLYAIAIVGIGVAVGGLWRASGAAEVAAVVVVATYLLDLLAPPLKLPDALHQLALTAHFGTPMVGDWEPLGIILCLGIGAIGILVGAFGASRRDLER
jgi:ABC-2 type transport system permease protein